MIEELLNTTDTEYLRRIAVFCKQRANDCRRVTSNGANGLMSKRARDWDKLHEAFVEKASQREGKRVRREVGDKGR